VSSAVPVDDLAARRVQYETAGLDVADVADDPVVQWQRWYDEAAAAGVAEPNAMVLATVDDDGRPDARFVLARGLDERGFVFHTNYESVKSQQLTRHPHAAGVFSWLDLHRQVRVRGPVERVTPEESDAYFGSRPRGSQIGAWASPQSEVIADRGALERRIADVEVRFAGTVVPRPDYWGGWRLGLAEIEFWQGRPSRLHDRIRYRPAPAGSWQVQRLAP
jgi:pyridoxamine 5'-phosphate oxidase